MNVKSGKLRYQSEDQEVVATSNFFRRKGHNLIMKLNLEGNDKCNEGHFTFILLVRLRSKVEHVYLILISKLKQLLSHRNSNTPKSIKFKAKNEISKS